jgi:hypothetical protein
MDGIFRAESGYTRATFTGLRTYDRIIAFLEAARAHAERTQVFFFLFDLRDSQEGMNVGDKYNLGIFLAEMFGARFRAVALLHRDQITGFLENVSRNRGASQFRIIHDEDEAREWLENPA